MSATVKLTDYFKDKLKKDEEVGKSTLSGALPALGAQVVGNNTTPKLTDALKITTPTMTNPGTVNTELLAGGANPTPNINADVLNLKFTPIASGNNTNTTAVVDNMPKYTDALGNSYSPTYTEFSTGDSSTGDSTYTENEIVTSAEPMSFEEYILSLKSKADDQYKRDILNAKNAYEQSKSAYGAQAAALGNMGLTGSGYSDYLDSRAYGQMQADKNAAARTREDTKLAADAQYMDYFNQQQTNKQNAYTTLLGNISYATTEADIDNSGKAYGLSADEINTLKQTRLDRIKAYLDNNNYDANVLKTLFPNGGAEYDAYYKKMQDDFGNFDESWIYDENGNLISKQSALEKIDAMSAAGFTPEQIATAKEKIEAAYAISNGGNVTFKKDNAVDNGPYENTGRKGNNITLKDADGNKYRVEYDGTEGDKAVNTAAKNRGLKENDVFMYDNKVYVIIGGKCYGLQKRTNSTNAWNGSWNSLVAKLKETTKSSEE